MAIEPSDHQPRVWYVLRAVYGKEVQTRDHILSHGLQAYVPFLYVRKEVKSQFVEGKTVRKNVRQPVNNLVFIRGTRQEVESFVRPDGDHYFSYLRYYYNHLQGHAPGSEDPIIIPDAEMEQFMHVADVDDRYVQMVTLEECHFRDKQKVQVNEGRFKGVEGFVARVHRQQCVIVGAGCFHLATSYIPTKYFKPLASE